MDRHPPHFSTGVYSRAAQHKPLLLLVVFDLIKDGKLAGGLLARDGNLAFRFNSYWTIVAERRDSRPDVRLPFYHIKSDGFWTPLDAEGKPAESRDRTMLAQFDVSFLLCAQDAEFRALARRALVAKYFQPHERVTLYGLVGMEPPPEDIIAGDAARFQEPPDERKRDARFCFRVLPACDFTCALTCYRMVAIDGKTAVDAAHIHQFRGGGPNHPTNGIALSKTAHWLFDRGFWSIGDDFLVAVKAERFEEAGDAGQLLKPRTGGKILLPASRSYWPTREFLAWHRQERGFKAAQVVWFPGWRAVCRPFRAWLDAAKPPRAASAGPTCHGLSSFAPLGLGWCGADLKASVFGRDGRAAAGRTGRGDGTAA